ncbi:MAG: BMP family ABC transporter substrate-binding protein [Chloroflexi bacterium]|nr:MAG: BMP family ABC transporter substrate-binding protein [Chloroflexota bacterium]
MAAFGVEGQYLESQQQTDYEVNINAFVEEECDLIVAIGFLLGDATAAAAEANPDQKFGIVDVNYLAADNLYGSGFAINESTFLNGYLAAGMSETGIVATYGGINIPPVTIFLDGFVLGVDYYNEVHGTDVQVLGWDVEAQDGLFVGNFESTDDGRTMGESLMDEGADVIMPVAGPVGAGTLAVMEERGTGLLIGVDNDWSLANPSQADYILSSAMKNMDLYVYETVESVINDTFAGGTNYLGTLENGGVGITYGSAMGDKIPADLQAEVDALVPMIVGGQIATLPGQEVMEEAPAEEAMAEPIKVCQVTDVGGIDDKSFNATAWKGVEDAMVDFDVEGQYLESQQQTDYEVNINAFIEEECDLIVAIGFLLGDATAAAAEANPDQKFGIVDVNYLAADNLYGSGFAINESTFLNGYLAAGMRETGIVATYGGINIPPVTIFMDGFVLGVEYYNEVHGTDVSVLGWDVEAQDGLFVGNFESTDDGRTMGESLMDEGADVIMPVAGPVGAGTLAVMEERDTGLLVGVDNDWSLANPSQADYILSSAMKNMDLYVYETIQSVMDDTFAGGTNYLGTLENGGVGLTYGSAMGDTIPAELQAEVDALIPMIVGGEIATLPASE